MINQVLEKQVWAAMLEKAGWKAVAFYRYPLETVLEWDLTGSGGRVRDAIAEAAWDALGDQAPDEIEDFENMPRDFTIDVIGRDIEITFWVAG
jgi:hypothetical protein